MEELTVPGRNKLVRQKVVFVHSRQYIRVVQEPYNQYLYSIQEEEVKLDTKMNQNELDGAKPSEDASNMQIADKSLSFTGTSDNEK